MHLHYLFYNDSVKLFLEIRSLSENSAPFIYYSDSSKETVWIYIGRTEFTRFRRFGRFRRWIYTDRQKACSTLLILFQKLTPFKKYGLCMIGSPSQTDFMHQPWNFPVRSGGIRKNVKNTDFDPNNQINPYSIKKKILRLFHVCNEKNTE